MSEVWHQRSERGMVDEWMKNTEKKRQKCVGEWRE